MNLDIANEISAKTPNLCHLAPAGHTYMEELNEARKAIELLGGKFEKIETFNLEDNSKINYKIFPIEVKSGKKYQTKSLDRFVEKYKDRIGEAYVIHPRNLTKKENGIICIPAYMVYCL